MANASMINLINNLTNAYYNATFNTMTGALSPNCTDLAFAILQTEDLLCGVTQVGNDGCFWAMGALGVVYLFHIWSLKMCSKRLDFDSKWLFMAILLKSQYDKVIE
jgi:hypothetical protein